MSTCMKRILNTSQSDITSYQQIFSGCLNNVIRRKKLTLAQVGCVKILSILFGFKEQSRINLTLL